ncbi:MerC domain-containing protein [Sediminibacterium roseum]|uniref:MerC domain-containing protein n=1 Tax=Sediminibacterium roseum TaxID=1978412 RepID=A0ABX0A0T4_9BACT|nr:MerC domain-containing protein [Sediminibacterium roseum]NCI51913.1 MerC domain-containing protein [Sediminibacterium roseum]
MKVKINWDALGIATSVACAIHCALLPLFLTSLPLFGYNIIENTVFEFIMIGISFLIGAYSLYHGRKKHHHSWWPLFIFAAGILFLFAKMGWHEWRLWLLAPAVVCIVVSHFLNYRLCRHHDHGHTDDCDH